MNKVGKRRLSRRELERRRTVRARLSSQIKIKEPKHLARYQDYLIISFQDKIPTNDHHPLPNHQA